MSDSAAAPPPGPRPVPLPADQETADAKDQAKPEAAAEPAAKPVEVPKPDKAAEDPPKKQGGGGGNNNRKNRNNRNQPKPAPAIIEVAPIAAPARMRRRHWGVLFSFFLLVIGPVVVSGWYLWTQAKVQYASTVGFTIRQEESGSASDLIGGVASSLGGVSTQKDADILYAYMQSQDLVSRIDERLDLRGHYSAPWDDDKVFAIWPDATIEDLTWYWSRIARIAYDATSGLIDVQIVAFDPEMAHDVAVTVLDESQRLINDLNAQARADTMRYAEEDLEEALIRLKGAREALTVFRTRTQIVDPQTDIQGRMGVVNTLQQQLAAALIERDLLAERTNASDPRVTQAERRIEVIRARIAEERQNFASGEESIEGDDYPTLLAEYEGLVVDREFAEESYRAALAALDVARANANRQSRYLAAYIQPTIPQTAEFPRRFVLMGLIALFSFLAWSIMALIYYSIRDSR